MRAEEFACPPTSLHNSFAPKRKQGVPAKRAEKGEGFGKASGAPPHLSAVAGRMFQSEGLVAVETELHTQCRKNKQKARPEECTEYSGACVPLVS